MPGPAAGMWHLLPDSMPVRIKNLENFIPAQLGAGVKLTSSEPVRLKIPASG